LEDLFATEKGIDGLRLKDIDFQTIKSFKGLESPCVIAIFEPDDLDDNGVILITSEFEKLLYVGLSRAQIVLSIIGNRKQIKIITSKQAK